MGERVSVIVNPEAGRGRGRRMIPEITARFAEAGITDIRTTSAAGEERAIARDAIASGATTLAVVGGDGTTSHVANAILESGSDVRLAILPAGTGNDFAKVLGTNTTDIASVAMLCAHPGGVHVDVGKVEDRYFLNCCGFGFDVAVLEGIARTQWLRGNAVYLYSALRQVLSYKGTRASVAGDSNDLYMLVVVANSEYFGGMFRIAPGARVTDGELDAISVRNLSKTRRLKIFRAAVNGDHAGFPECSMDRAASFALSFPEAPSYETDGELHRARTTDLTVTCCPSALRVVTAQ
jgi:diacylglycerol kinase (ATP)